MCIINISKKSNLFTSFQIQAAVIRIELHAKGKLLHLITRSFKSIMVLKLAKFY